MSKKVFKLREDGSLLTPEFRVSFPRVFEADDNGKFGVSMIFDRDVDFSALEKVIAAKKKDKWPQGPKGVYMEPILDGDESQASREELVGKMYINAKAGKYRPGLVGPDNTEIRDEAEFYPGCWARATINVYPWSFKGKCGISVGVRNIQKLRDDEPLISRTKAADEFDVVDTNDDDL
jgi:hypothetical protein